MAAAGALIMVLAGCGAGRLRAESAVGWRWVAAGSLASAAGIWAGVPETGPAVLAGACLSGLAASGALTRAKWAPGAGMGLAAVLGWAALSGASGRPWAAVGGALCSGVAPSFALWPRLPVRVRSRPPGPWLLVAHLGLVVLAARWVGVDPDAGWARVVILAIVGLGVAGVTRRRA